MVSNNPNSTDIKQLIKELADDLDHNFSVTTEGEVTIEVGSVSLTICKKSNWYFNAKSKKEGQ